ncbi:MAG TPA: nuclear transport factor 2 family protein [Gemmatimonadota bacterium]|nr:nuclear transport factor 2 family protein [Gemmatimonadota bacterium]
MNHRDAETLVDDMAAAWNVRDLERYLSYLTEDVVWADPAMPVPAVGREAVRAFSESVLRAFPDFCYEIRHPVCVAADGSRCAVAWTIRATSLGSLDPPGFGPSGRAVEFQGVDLLEFRAGEVSRIDTYFDVREPTAQLLSVELRPAPGSPMERIFVWAQRARAAWLRRFRKVPRESAGLDDNVD